MSSTSFDDDLAAVLHGATVRATVEGIRERLTSCPVHQLDTALRESLERLGTLLEVDRIGLHLLDEHLLTLASEWAGPDDATPTAELSPRPVDESAAWMERLRSGQTVTATDDGTLDEPLRTMIGPGCSTALLVPLRSFGDMIGLLALSSPEVRSFTAQERSSLAQVADLITGAWVRREARSSLGRAQTRLTELLRHIDDALLILDRRGVCKWASASVERFGIAPDRLRGVKISQLLVDEDAAMLRGLAVEWDEADPAAILEVPEVQLVTPLGIRWVTGALRNLRHVPGVEGDLLTIRDVTERRQTLDSSRRHAMTDPLTRLPNRTALRRDIEEQFADETPGTIGLLFLDFDRFKLINDTRGHTVGDELLRQAADRLGRLARPHERIARFGGDEFVVLLRETTATGVQEAAARFGKALSSPYFLDGGLEELTASMGLRLCFAGHESDPDVLLRDADTALFVAKERGRNRLVVFDPEMAAVTARRSIVTARLREALEHGLVVAQFQPIIHLRSGRTSGVEALARWTDPELGPVSPGEFIPIAEETGLIQQLGLQMLSQSMSTFAAWPDPLTVSVNVSARQLEEPDMAGRIQQLLRETGMAPDRIRIEVTESMLMRDPVRAAAILHELRGIGLTVALDDFGTGHSSLAVLRDLPLDVLKIDQSFIGTLHEDETNHEMVQTIISMARHFGLATVAEGVELEAQAELLRTAGCDYVQGWLHGAAMPAAQLASQLGVRLPAAAAQAGSRPEPSTPRPAERPAPRHSTGQPSSVG
jgi:diguanylate cyclase (GGDEF)-like protein